MDSFALNVKILAVQFVPFMMAVVFHEVAHGYMAKLYGDTTAEDAGRLTFNPLPHVDPLGTFLFPVMGMLTGLPVLFGWARPVPINPTRFKKYRSGLFWVSFAGPGMNVILAVFSAAVYCAMLKFVSSDHFLFEPVTLMAQGSVYLNFALCVFNLIPLPPLDGSKMVQSFLSYNATQKYEMLSQYSFWILLALIMTGALGYIVGGPIMKLASLTLYAMGSLFGLTG